MAELEKIEQEYNEVIERLENSFIEPIETHALIEVLKKAKAWDIFKAKCGQGGRKASKNLNKKQRIDRARNANKAKQAKAQKEKERRHQRQIDKHRI